MLPGEYEMLRHVWFPLARVEDVAKTGVVGANILGEELVVYRVAGVSTVAGAYCPHRGMALSLGQLTRDSLECPYHGWRFAPGSGACTAVAGAVGQQVPRCRITFEHVREPRIGQLRVERDIRRAGLDGGVDRRRPGGRRVPCRRRCAYPCRHRSRR